MQTSAHYFGLVGVPRELLERHAVSTDMATFRGYQLSENQDFIERGAA
jgi:hypothetical protein